jgi:hypothetical protein
LKVLVEPLAFDELHGVEDAAVWQRADVMHGNDAGVLEGGEYLSFVNQAAG